MKLKELAEQYRENGIFTDEMELLQNAYILDNIQEYYDDFKENEENLDMRFEVYVGIMVGTWQAEHGFTQTMDQVRKKLKGYPDDS